VPTLIINAEDDPLSSFENAAQAAQRIPGARLVPAATGGHLLLGQEAHVREEVAALAAVHPAGSPRTENPADVPRDG
jgi:pimeloyl-ACP methyl ester carboxylesterase